VKTFSEWADKGVFADAKKLLSRARKDYSYDIPFLAGYSTDGKTFYVDRNFPAKWGEHDVHQFLLRHESVEKAAMEAGLGYKEAHKLAVRAEREAVEAAGLKWKEYQAHCTKAWQREDKPKVSRIPKDLDLSFHHEGDDDLLDTIKNLME
jgi:hypothetical protein